MAKNDVVYWQRRSEKLDGLDVSPMSNFEKAHVLVVNDCVLNRKIIEYCLHKIASCKVTAVDSGLKALQLLKVDDLKLDLIITDYCMPEMTGYELLKKIKESPNLKEISVVIISSENVFARKEMCLEEGAKDFIIKPMKLLDVKRVMVYMKKDVGGVEESGINKRKLRESSGQPSSPPSILTSSPSSPRSSTSSFSAPTSSFSAPSSPTLLDSHITRLKRTYSDRLDHQIDPTHTWHLLCKNSNVLSSHVQNKKE